jgi:hypothetical protein
MVFLTKPLRSMGLPYEAPSVAQYGLALRSCVISVIGPALRSCVISVIGPALRSCVSSVVGRRGWDSNPRYPKGTPVFKTGAFVHSATPPPIQQFTERSDRKLHELEDLEPREAGREILRHIHNKLRVYLFLSIPPGVHIVSIKIRLH